MNGRRVLPNFLFIGPDKSGSTWMYEVLREHPQAFVPSVKDIYFFDRHYDRGLDWYSTFFAEAPSGVSAIGELSHDYLFSPEAALRIRRDLPDVRLLTSLRNPVERSFSQFLYMRRSGMTGESFEDAVEDYPEIIDNSRYLRHLQPYFETFGQGAVAVLFFDDLVADPRSFATRMLSFLALDTSLDLDYEARVLPASRARSQFLARVAKRGANGARWLGLPAVVGRIKGSPVTKLLYRPYRESERPELHSDTRRRLLDVFRPDIERLEELLGRDLSAWKGTEAP